MDVIFRVDASGVIGYGHVMRCLVLADGLRIRGIQSRFICRDLPGHAGSLISARGYKAQLLRPAERTSAESSAGLERARELADAVECLSLIGSAPCGLLVVDHYRLSAVWEQAMRNAARCMLAIDDLADRPHDCDILLDTSLHPDHAAAVRYQELVPPGCRLLLGVDYLLLDPSFCETAGQSSVRERVERLLLFFGGGDSDNLTGHALQELDGLGIPGDVVIGAANPHRECVSRLCAGGPWTLHIQTDRMAMLTARSDLAVGAGGSSHWERCVSGLPAVVVSVAENQVATTQMLASRGACCYLGDRMVLAPGSMREAVSDLAQNPARLRAMSQAAYQVVPGMNSTERVVEVLTGSAQCWDNL